MGLHSPAYNPHVLIQTSADLKLRYLLDDHSKAANCEAATITMTTMARATCPQCTVVLAQCLPSLEPALGKLLTEQPINTPSVRLPNGIINYESGNADLALATCKETEKIAAQAGNSFTCAAAGSPRPAFKSNSSKEDPLLALGLLVLALSGIASMLVNYLVVRYQHLHSRWSMDQIDNGPQKFHTTPTPRIGGLGILIGMLISGIGLLVIQPNAYGSNFGLLLLASLPAFAGGFAEDLLKTVGVYTRLLLTMLSAIAAIWLLGGTYTRLDIPFIDDLFKWAPVIPIVFTIIAIAGIANATNIIDGYNGLASGYSVLVLGAIATVAYQVGDSFILGSALAMLGAQLGFLAWNYPGGKVFLGDGGAYILGFWLAVVSALLVARNSAVSPWFPLLLLIYPVFETLFSIYRKRILRGASPGHPDGLHLHMLIYKRLIRKYTTADTPEELAVRNSMVSIYIWVATTLCIFLAVMSYRNTAYLMLFSLFFCVAYVWFYSRIVKWKTPRWAVNRTKST